MRSTCDQRSMCTPERRKQNSPGLQPIAVNLSDIATGGAHPWPQFGGALHSAFSGLWHVDADRPFAGVAFNKMRRPGVQRGFKRCMVENASRSLHAPREPQLSTRLGLPHDKSFSRSKDRTCLMRLPSDMGGACALTAATSLGLTPMGLKSRAVLFSPFRRVETLKC